jgi:glycosyltransferase involved in cell wall biosynthesis
MPNSLLEALAMGVPAIAFAIPPVLELENRTGALIPIPPFEVELFAKAILRLSKSPHERIDVGERGRRTVLSRFLANKNMAIALKRIAQTRRQENSAPTEARQQSAESMLPDNVIR